MHRIRTLVIKELQTLLRDRQGRALLIVPVLLQLAVFPFAATLEVKNNTLGVFNEDSGAESIELLQRLARAEAFTGVVNVHSEEELHRAIDRQEALLVVRVPADFSRAARLRWVMCAASCKHGSKTETGWRGAPRFRS